MGRLVAEINKDQLGEGLLATFASINFLHFAIFLFLVCVGLLVVASLLSKPPGPDQIRGLTYGTMTAEDRRVSRASWTRGDLIHSALIVLIIAAILVIFSPLGIAGGL